MTLITKNGFCPACMMTQKLLDSLNVKYTVKHLNNNIALKNHLKDLGIQQYPVVEFDDKLDDSTTWGFRPEKLRAYAKSQNR